MLHLFRAFAAVLLLLAIALVSALVTMRLAIHGAEVRVPSLSGLPLSDAMQQLRASDLQTGIDGHYYSPEQPAGNVLTQSPAPGTPVRKSWRVRLTVSLGPQKVAIPSVDGMSETLATITIRRTGLRVGNVIAMPYAFAPEHTVIAQTPTAHATDVQGPQVSILTAQAVPPPDDADVMPDFTGESFTQAALAIVHAGFRLAPLQTSSTTISAATQSGESAAAIVTTVPSVEGSTTSSVSIPTGSVIAQMPAAGGRIPVGATIQLTVQP